MKQRLFVRASFVKPSVAMLRAIVFSFSYQFFLFIVLTIIRDFSLDRSNFLIMRRVVIVSFFFLILLLTQHYIETMYALEGHHAHFLSYCSNVLHTQMKLSSHLFRNINTILS